MKRYLTAPRIVLAALFVAALLLVTQSTTQAQGPRYGGPGLYVVQYGDTLASIAARFGVSLRALEQANGFAPPYDLYAGRPIHVPYGGPYYGNGQFPYGGPMYSPPQYGPGYVPPSSGSYTRYVVQFGDTLSSIAARYGVSMYQLQVINHIYNPNLLFAGMTLLIPSTSGNPPPCTSTYIVQWGDTLSRIALRFGTTVYALMIANNIPNANLIFAGQRLTIPRSSTNCPGAGTPTPTASAPPSGTVSPTATGSQTPAGTATVSPTRSAPPSGTVSPTTTRTQTPAGTATVSPTISGSATVAATRTAPSATTVPTSTRTP